ncbi:ABC transporter permease subunit [Iocasia frigidifontis]|uniref:ABC transporter permease subunit n=1 Tax=Iocasia fonsfrigidae TaxID=2682810 RepID=A0A8A7KBU7_9FIRM|nr:MULTISPECIES: proline/glycine betaine ABC transporter permease [Halanaerobiaceae]AZO96045.1 proline/glycine betaine ABC transporter permease [Halocella sp. SP3-1]MTI60153.1 proline/glycine betaine ABC transporter permease [Bacillota bacterium]QTL98921.1 ABC transporter permease subunit [Iocasia fonsfrigidae]
MINLPIGSIFDILVKWLSNNADSLFDFFSSIIGIIIINVEGLLLVIPPLLFIIILAALAWYLEGRNLLIFTVVGFMIILSMDLWSETMETLAMVLSSGVVTLSLGIPLGILAAKKDLFDKIIRPVLDFMQTMPSFVYLIPAVIFFGMGMVPGVIATVIFSMPPVIRLTNLGLRQVDKEVIEAARSFGSTGKQILLKVQLPLAIPTIMAGINQAIMLSLSMVVISSMIGAGGLGGIVLRGITQLKIGMGFEGGLGVVILAIFLDRITQSFTSE